MNNTNQTTTNQPLQEDEIDLRELFVTIKQQWKVVVSSVIIAIISASIYLYITPPTYSQSILIKMPILTNSTNNINNIIQPLLAEKQKASSFYSFELSKTQPANMLAVDVLLSSPSDFARAQADLLGFLNENNTTKPLLDKARNDTKRLISQINEENAKNIKIKEIVKAGILGLKNSNIGFNPIAMDEVILSLLEKRDAYENTLVNMGNFELINAPRTPTKPIKPKPIQILSLAIMVGLILGVFLSLLVGPLVHVETNNRSQ